MSWKFNPFTSNLDYYEGYKNPVIHTESVILSLADLKKVHIMDVTGGARAFWLPDVSTGMIGEWVILVRQDDTSLLRVWAHAGDRILNSTAGGYLECNEAGRDWASLLLVVIADGQWGNPSYGIWETH